MEYLKTLRTQKGVSQQTVADYLEITRQAYSNYENGNREPDYETLLKLAEYFGTSVDVLLRGEPQDASLNKSKITEEELKVALFGGDSEVTDEMWNEATFAIQLIKERHKKGKDKND